MQHMRCFYDSLDVFSTMLCRPGIPFVFQTCYIQPERRSLPLFVIIVKIQYHPVVQYHPIPSSCETQYHPIPPSCEIQYHPTVSAFALFVDLKPFLKSIQLQFFNISKPFYQIQPSDAARLQRETCRLGDWAEGQVLALSGKMGNQIPFSRWKSKSNVGIPKKSNFAPGANTLEHGWSPRDYWSLSIIEK